MYIYILLFCCPKSLLLSASSDASTPAHSPRRIIILKGELLVLLEQVRIIAYVAFTRSNEAFAVELASDGNIKGGEPFLAGCPAQWTSGW